MAWLARTSRLLGATAKGAAVEATVLVIGVRNAGKSTFMKQMKPRHIKMDYFSPLLATDEKTKAEKFTSNALTFISFDLDDPEGYGYCWEDLYATCSAVIVVVDCSDHMNISYVRNHVTRIVANKMLKKRLVPLLFLANKSDKVSAMSTIQLADVLDLHGQSVKVPWIVTATDSITGDGFNEAFDWLAHQMKSQFSTKKAF